ncbi:MAG: transglutaminase family protein [Betaproteobacteria bacterium]
MSIRIALNHRSHYTFDRGVAVSPHEVRLRPAPHCRTPILSYSLTVLPEKHFINWQQDAYGNYVARLVFPEKTNQLRIEVDLVADLTVINPFDFFVESYAETFPFAYPALLQQELKPYLDPEPAGPLLTRWLAAFRRDGFKPGMGIVDFLVAANQRVQRDIAYLVRMQPGVQTPDETLQLACGSCRDSGWLLVQILRHMGLAARFVSGYLIQLTADQKALDGPSGTDKDFTDLHAWAEVYIPGAGWIGLDPTSGLMAGEGHIPLACTALTGSAAAIIGFTDVCESTLDFAMTVTRIHEDPRVTKPYTETQWQDILKLGARVDADLAAGDVRLTQGGEPTFVSIDDMEGAEWNYTALSPKKWTLAEQLARRLAARFASGPLLHYGQGKWYPGEPLPRWALGILWRTDGKPLWRNAALIAAEDAKTTLGAAEAQQFGAALAAELGLDANHLISAYEDVLKAVQLEDALPDNVDPLKAKLDEPGERARLARLLGNSLGKVAGYVLPLKALEGKTDATQWHSSPWPVRREHLYLLPGDSAMGYRLPLASLPDVLPEEVEVEFPRDPFDAASSLHDAHSAAEKARGEKKARSKTKPKPRDVVRTALVLEARGGRLHVFLPPLQRLEDFVNLIAAIENVAAALKMPVRTEGYGPPFDTRLKVLNVTPDPGVIEVNIHPAKSWDELVQNTTILYEEARLGRLGTEKFMLDGRHTGTGGGNHVTLGGITPADSPMLRRPDLLASLITYWQNHPALSYLFSGQFLGPTSQAPRVDEARDDNLYELEIAFQQIAEHLAPGKESPKPWLIDRLLRHLLVDLTGNTHRAEFSIDKLYSPDGPTGRLGLVEFRAFEMPPHARMSLVQMLLLRALVARFWKTPYKGRLIYWGTELHDRFMLPHFIEQDMRDVLRDLAHAGYDLREEWYAPFLEFRFPRHGTTVYEGVQIELRQAIEPWHVLGEEVALGATARYVDSSVERLQVKVNGMISNRHLVACNGRAVPLHPTGTHGEFVAAVRYRAWNPPSALHPTIDVHSPLVFDLLDTWSGRSLGGCTYHVVHPGGRSYDSFPVNANEAEARRVARFWSMGHTPGPMDVKTEPLNPQFPYTLDLRRRPV